MYCMHCGKQLADNAVMCPGCGAPTVKENKQPEKPKGGVINRAGLAVSSIVLSMIGFVTGFIYITICLATGGSAGMAQLSALLISLVDTISLLPAFAGLILAILTLCKRPVQELQKQLAISSIVFSGVIILYYFIDLCLMFA